MMTRLKILVLMLLIVVVLIVIVQNSDTITLRFLAWDTNISLLAVLLVTALLGLAIGYIVGRLGRRSRGNETPRTPPAQPPQ